MKKYDNWLKGLKVGNQVNLRDSIYVVARFTKTQIILSHPSNSRGEWRIDRKSGYEKSSSLMGRDRVGEVTFEFLVKLKRSQMVYVLGRFNWNKLSFTELEELMKTCDLKLD